MLKQLCYLLSGIVLLLDKLITLTYNSSMMKLFKIPIYLVLYPIFYVLGLVIIIIGYLMGYNLLPDDEEKTDSL